MGGQRKVAWRWRHEHGRDVADASCLQILREAGLTLPVDSIRQRRDLAGARREAFVERPKRRKPGLAEDVFELKTSGAETWRCGEVIDDATKLVLAGPLTSTQTARDAIASGSGRAGARRRAARPAAGLRTSSTPTPASCARSSRSPTTARALRAPRSPGLSPRGQS